MQDILRVHGKPKRSTCFTRSRPPLTGVSAVRRRCVSPSRSEARTSGHCELRHAFAGRRDSADQFARAVEIAGVNSVCEARTRDEALDLVGGRSGVEAGEPEAL